MFFTPFTAMIAMFLILRADAIRSFAKRSKSVQEKIKTLDGESQEKTLKRLRKSYKQSLWTRAGCSIFWPLFFMGTCISFYNKVGFIQIDGFSLSTELSRAFLFNDACPKGSPCHVYATLPEDASTSVFINAHTNVAYDSIVVNWDTEEYYISNDELRFSADSYSFQPENLERKAWRNVHSALLTAMEPDTVYVIQIVYDGKVQYQDLYRTLPGSDNPRDIIFASGGDMGANLVSFNLTMGTGDYDPDVLVVGGDLAYDDAICSCYWTWDMYLDEFTELNAKAGRLVPILFGIGNHDVGLNTLSGRQLTVDLSGPSSMLYFPQHTDGTGTVPDITSRRSYHYHTFGNILFFIMDSGYLTSYYGDQIQFISDVSEQYPSYVKFNSYHNPTFYTCNHGDSDAVQQGLTIWNPIFDKYLFAAAFENHEHTFKKSYPLRGNQRNPLGTYYLGNGNWGANIHNCTWNDYDNLYEIYNSIHHFWLVNVSADANLITYSAYDNLGNEAIDPFSQNITDYTF